MSIRGRILITILLIALLPCVCAAELQFRVGGDGSFSVTGIDEEVKSLVIPASIGGNPVTKIEAGAFQGMGSLREVIISEGISEIGAGAFRSCVNLSSVSLPKSLEKVDETAFDNTAYYMNELKKLYPAPEYEQPSVDNESAKAGGRQPAGKGAQAAGIVMAILIIVAALFVYFAVLPNSKKGAPERESEAASPQESDGTEDSETTSEAQDPETEAEQGAEAAAAPEQSPAPEKPVDANKSRSVKAYFDELGKKAAEAKAKADTSNLSGRANLRYEDEEKEEEE